MSSAPSLEAVRVDDEFRDAISPLSKAELEALEESIVAEGCRDPLVVWDGVLLDGHHRLAICTSRGIGYGIQSIDLPDRTAALDWIDRNQLGRRNLTPDQFRYHLGRRYARKKKAPHRPANDQAEDEERRQSDAVNTGRTREALAEEHGVSPRTVERAEKFAAEVEAEPELKEALKSGKSVKAAKKKVTKKRREEKEEAAIEASRNVDISDLADLRVMSCRELFASGVRPDVVITDPPYPKEFLHTFTELAESCREAAVPVVAVMSGQSYLPEVFERLCEHLTYRWAMAYLTPGGQAVQQWTAKVITTWKPILVFGAPGDDWLGDVATSEVNDNDKRFHEWGQSESGMADIVRRLSKPGDLVCDPFLGGGTTAAVCVALGRKFVGCDTDPSAVDITRARVAKTVNLR